MNNYEHRKDLILLLRRLLDIDLSLMEPMVPTATTAAGRTVMQPSSIIMKQYEAV